MCPTHPAPAASRRASRAGFTLPEVVFAAVIMAGGLAIFMTAFSFAAKCVYDARNQMLAVNYAREQLESRRIFTFRAPELDAGTYTVTNALYNGTVVITNLRTNEKSIAVTVLWTNYALRAACTARYETIIVNAIH